MVVHDRIRLTDPLPEGAARPPLAFQGFDPGASISRSEKPSEKISISV
jgi:hypothetical protein